MVDRFTRFGIAAGLAFAPAVGFGQASESAPDSPQAESAGPAAATQPAPDRLGEPADTSMQEVVVTTTRTEKPYSDLTRSVSVIDRKTIEQQAAISRDLGDILGKTVPGLGTSTEARSNFTQTLRGRNFLTMVDGIPISTPLRDGALDLKILDPSSIERVEVVRGGTAQYGFGATGGIINFITREPSGEKLTGFSEAGFGFSTEHPDGSVKWHTAHGVSGSRDGVDFLFNASLGQRNRFFDADGDRIPTQPLFNQGGLADTTEWNVLGKFGFDFDDKRQRLELTLNSYDIEQDTGFVTVPGALPDQKATAEGGNPPGKNSKTENQLVNVTYKHRDVLGSEVKVQSYYQDYVGRFGFAPGGFQTQGTSFSEKFGTRLTVTTPLGDEDWNPELIWGLDFQNEQFNEPVNGANPFAVPDIPELDQDALAGFAELKLPVGDLGLLRGGVRHEQVWVNVADGTGIQGGDLDFSETLFNLTAVGHVTDNIDLFGGFSQGFAPAQLGRFLQNEATPAPIGSGFVAADQIDFEAQKVDNYELGLRGRWDRVRGEVVGFFSESNRGTTFDDQLRVVRQPEEIWGVESSLAVDVTPRVTVGGTTTWIDGRADLDGDGDLDEELPSSRIPPYKLTGFVEYEPTDWWQNRLQVLHSGSRDPDGQVEIDPFTVVDYYSSFKIGKGELRIGVENVLNEDYFPVASQEFNFASALSKGQGRAVTLSYRIQW